MKIAAVMLFWIIVCCAFIAVLGYNDIKKDNTKYQTDHTSSGYCHCKNHTSQYFDIESSHD